MTIEDIKKGNGIDGNLIYFGLNGKVMEFMEGFTMGELFKKAAGGHLELR
jgi:hypothetical protein